MRVLVGGILVWVGMGLVVAASVLVLLGINVTVEVDTTRVSVAEGLFVAVGDSAASVGVNVEMLGGVGVADGCVIKLWVADGVTPPEEVTAGTGVFKPLNTVARRSGKSVGDWSSANALLIRFTSIGGISSCMGSFA